MAALQERGGSFRVLFRHGGRQHSFNLGKVSRAEAEATLGVADLALIRLREGTRLPEGVDLVTFVRHGGRPPAPEQETPARDKAAGGEPTLGTLRDDYLKAHPEGTLERHTLRGIRRHFKHLAGHFGERFKVRALSFDDLQGYVDARKLAKGRRGALDPATIRKEVVTLRTAWNWGVRRKIVSGPFPSRGLVYPKGDEPPPFRTRAEIERLVRGRPADARLWEALYLTLPGVEALLAHVEASANHPWIHPMVATAAHTGARKGELLRMEVGDVDFESRAVTIRERKRSRDRRTTRRVPLSTALEAVLRAWLVVHPGGPMLFAQAEEVGRSKRRSPTTGHSWKDRPGRMAERRASVRRRERPGLLPLTEDEAGDHLRRTLAGSEWAVVRGFHVLRHSFISACASRGVDQRLIDEWVGHQTDEQRRRYRHLYPSVQAEAIRGVFG